MPLPQRLPLVAWALALMKFYCVRRRAISGLTLMTCRHRSKTHNSIVSCVYFLQSMTAVTISFSQAERHFNSACLNVNYAVRLTHQ